MLIISGREIRLVLFGSQVLSSKIYIYIYIINSGPFVGEIIFCLFHQEI